MKTRRWPAAAGVAAATLALLVPAAARADWTEEDGHKMHYPQLPDPTGWDINMTGFTVADDWRCSGSGPVDGIHFWVSWHDDGGHPTNIMNVHLSVHADVPDPDGPGPAYSMPGALLWQRDVPLPMLQFTGPFVGLQGWYDPAIDYFGTADHNLYWQINVPVTVDPFIQTMDEIYWLDINLAVDSAQPAGWKTSVTNFNDDAVWWDPDPGVWRELHDPLEPTQSLDVAFVIVPEPGTAALGGAAALVLAGVLRQRGRRRARHQP